MEAATPKRAAIRLALLGAGVAMTVVMTVTTVYLATRPEAAASERAEWDKIETGKSYQLPTATDTPPATPTPVALNRTPGQVAYQPPAYTEPVADPTPTEASGPSLAGPVTIHNPAAFGPPEDDTLPPPPGEGPPIRVSAMPRGPVLTAPAGVSTPPVAEVLPPAPPNISYQTEAPSRSEIAQQRLQEQLLAERDARHVAPPVASIVETPREINAAHLGYTLSTNELSKRLEKEVQSAFNLGKSGAVYAARDRFVGVLRRIALAKDAEQGSTHHAKALAEGLRTLDDADDFVPRGDALEAELDVAAIAGSHGQTLAGQGIAPHEAIARYSHHAAQRLAAAAAGEPAGSMALYGLGKTYARLEAQGDLTAGRKSAVMYRAAVQTHPENYLAANELGVRLARDGHYEHASEVLRQAAQRPEAIAMVHANLAAVEQKLGRRQQAVFAQAQGMQLAQRERRAGEVSRRHGVQWMSPDDFRRMGSAPVAAASQQAGAPQQAVAASAPVYQQAAPQPSGFSGWMQSAKRAIGWDSSGTQQVATPVARYGPPVVGTPQQVVR